MASPSPNKRAKVNNNNDDDDGDTTDDNNNNDKHAPPPPLYTTIPRALSLTEAKDHLKEGSPCLIQGTSSEFEPSLSSWHTHDQWNINNILSSCGRYMPTGKHLTSFAKKRQRQVLKSRDELMNDSDAPCNEIHVMTRDAVHLDISPLDFFSNAFLPTEELHWNICTDDRARLHMLPHKIRAPPGFDLEFLDLLSLWSEKIHGTTSSHQFLAMIPATSTSGNNNVTTSQDMPYVRAIQEEKTRSGVGQHVLRQDKEPFCTSRFPRGVFIMLRLFCDVKSAVNVTIMHRKDGDLLQGEAGDEDMIWTQSPHAPFMHVYHHELTSMEDVLLIPPGSRVAMSSLHAGKSCLYIRWVCCPQVTGMSFMHALQDPLDNTIEHRCVLWNSTHAVIDNLRDARLRKDDAAMTWLENAVWDILAFVSYLVKNQRFDRNWPFPSLEMDLKAVLREG